MSSQYFYITTDKWSIRKCFLMTFKGIDSKIKYLIQYHKDIRVTWYDGSNLVEYYNQNKQAI